jgi:AhpC/TSA family
MVLRAVAIGLVLFCASCAAADRGALAPEVPSVPLVGPQGEPIDARLLARGAALTVLVFFSPDCHCLRLHEPRLRALFDAYHPRGVQFFMVDSEVRGSLERDATEARRRGYRFPILGDRGARLAGALGAEYATFTIVFDSQARIRYRGGIDTDRSHLHDGATAYLKDALDDLLAAREPRLSEGKTLGCSLQKW